MRESETVKKQRALHARWVSGGKEGKDERESGPAGVDEE